MNDPDGGDNIIELVAFEAGVQPEPESVDEARGWSAPFLTLFELGLKWARKLFGRDVPLPLFAVAVTAMGVTLAVLLFWLLR